MNNSSLLQKGWSRGWSSIVTLSKQYKIVCETRRSIHLSRLLFTSFQQQQKSYKFWFFCLFWNIYIQNIFQAKEGMGGAGRGLTNERPRNWSCDLRANQRPQHTASKGKTLIHNNNKRTEIGTLRLNRPSFTIQWKFFIRILESKTNSQKGKKTICFVICQVVRFIDILFISSTL